MSQPINFFKAFLAQALTAGGAETEIFLDRLTNLNGETIVTADFADLGRGVITVQPDGDGRTTYPESISFTGVSSANVSLTGAVRGLSGKSDTPVADNIRFHPVGTPVILSFGSHQIQDILDYVNTFTTTTRNVIVPAVAGETVADGNLVYLKLADGRWWKCDADDATTVENVQLAIAKGAGVAGGLIAGGGVMLSGRDTANSGLTVGATYYASNTAGGISSSAGTKEVAIGVGDANGFLIFSPRFSQQITEDEQDALAGTSGTPSASNKFVTADDQTRVQPAGTINGYGGFTAPSGWLLCEGAAVSRATYPTLFLILNPNLGAATITIASPGVVSLASHGMQIGDAIYFTTTGALPTGLSINTRYFIISAGFGAGSFQVSATLGGAAVNTSGSQSGVHTLFHSPFGNGDGTTTFTLPSLKGKVPLGLDTSDADFRAGGQTGGAKTHTLTEAEMPAHTHTYSINNTGDPGGGNSIAQGSGAGATATPATSSTGGGGAHNNLQPYIALRFIIKT